MHSYSIKKIHNSEKLHIQFNADPEDQEFRTACQKAFQPLGFELSFDGHYFYVSHPDKTSRYSKMSIESDQWGIVWGEASPWGDVDENHELIRIMDGILAASGLFSQR